MFKRKPETLALVIALVGTLSVLGAFIIDLAFARQRDIEESEKRLQHFSVMLAEHTARAFEAMDILLREMATDLAYNRRNWTDWTPSQGWEYVAQRHSRALPQLRDLIIFDSSGEQRFISTFFPPPAVNVRDRSYFQAIANGQEATTFGPFVGRNSNRYTYALARRIENAAGGFGGVALAAIDPVYLQEFCWSNRLSDDFEAVMTNAQGKIIASCRPTDLSKFSKIIGVDVDSALFDGALRGMAAETGMRRGNGYLVSISPVPGFPDLRILSALPERSVLASWRLRLFELGTLAGLVTLVLIVGGLLVRRQVIELSQLTQELDASHRDLEERIRHATQALAEERDTAERANKAKSRFLAAASHDLRQPLHALSLFAADLQRKVWSNTRDEVPYLAEQIAKSTALLGELLDSLLDISRLDVGGVTPDIRNCALAPIFSRLQEAAQRNALERQITVRIRPTRLWVESDPVMLERILANLLSNALNYTPSGGRILILARRRAGKVVIEVRDSGIGIAPEHQAAIFAEFYQIGNAAREHHKGLGLGLSIVDRLTRALHIEVGLDSRLGEGTTFRLHVAPGQPDISVTTPAPGGQILCLGNSDDMENCIRLLAHWHFDVARLDVLAAGLPGESVLLCDAAHWPEVQAWQEALPIIVLGTPASAITATETVHLLSGPVRPAKLRALVTQLQKTLSKSMP